MENEKLFQDLLRYGKIKADFEHKDGYGNWFRSRVIEYNGCYYFTVMCNGEPLKIQQF